jgi:hypothetical protein
MTRLPRQWKTLRHHEWFLGQRSIRFDRIVARLLSPCGCSGARRIERKNNGQCGLIRADPGCPGTLKRLPVSVTLVPSTRRMEKSLSD